MNKLISALVLSTRPRIKIVVSSLVAEEKWTDPFSSQATSTYKKKDNPPCRSIYIYTSELSSTDRARDLYYQRFSRVLLGVRVIMGTRGDFYKIAIDK